MKNVKMNVFLKGDNVVFGGIDQGSNELREDASMLSTKEGNKGQYIYHQSSGIKARGVVPLSINEVTVTYINEFSKSFELIDNFVSRMKQFSKFFLREETFKNDLKSLVVYNNKIPLEITMTDFPNLEETYLSHVLCKGTISESMQNFSAVNSNLEEIKFNPRTVNSSPLYIYVWHDFNRNSDEDRVISENNMNSFIKSLVDLGNTSPESEVNVQLRGDVWKVYKKKDELGEIPHNNNVNYKEFEACESC